MSSSSPTKTATSTAANHHHIHHLNNSSPTKTKLNQYYSLEAAAAVVLDDADRTASNPKRMRLSDSSHELSKIQQSTNNSHETNDEKIEPISTCANSKVNSTPTVNEQGTEESGSQSTTMTNNSTTAAAGSNSHHNNTTTSHTTNTNNHQNHQHHQQQSGANSNGAGNNAANAANNRHYNSEDHPEIDEALYSRQLYVLGHEAMRRMQASNVLICGMNGLGVEIAKNVILGGVKSVSIFDDQLTTYDDLSSQFYLSEQDLGKNRAACTQPLLAELNPYVPVKLIDKPQLTTADLNAFQVVVLTQSNTEEQLAFGTYCHENDIKILIAQTRGLFGQIFCDFGREFEIVDVDGEQPLSTMISAINNDTLGTVTTLDEQRHGFEDGMIVTFSEVKGMSEVNGKEFKIKVFGPYTFGIGDTTQFAKYIRGGYVHQVKKPKLVNFKPIGEASKSPETVISDFTKMDDSNTIHLAFYTAYEYAQRHGALPRPWHQEDADKFISLAKEINEREFKFDPLNDYVLRIFASTLVGQLSPMNAVIGGAAAQEIMKACSGKFTPISQYFYFDCREALPEKPFEHLNPAECTVSDADPAHLKRYKSQIAVFGRKFQSRLGRSRQFIVGAGALGCEYLKNFAMLGMCTKEENGRLIITDMDTIEKSNLNRQFLFRSHDVQNFKATVAANAAQRMNGHLNVVPHTNRVCPETEHLYNDSFFEQLDGVCNALDNIDARVYMDRRCVYYQKPLIESGTLGTKGNVQVVIPHLTESYSSTQDPPEKSIPICTLKNFPNAIEHTLQWARDMFEGVFTNPATAASEFTKNPANYIERVLKMQGSQPYEELIQVHKALVEDRPRTFEDCVKWARLHWQENYHNTIEQLLFNFPKDQLTSTGVPFWSGPKRCPHSLTFSVDNATHLEYVYTAANLKAEMYGLAQQRDRKIVASLAAAVQVAPFKAKQGVKIHTNDAEAQNALSSSMYEREHLDELIEKLKNLPDLDKLKMNAIEFEKDDDKNLHMDFIVACSNLRAENYDISPADRHKSKLIAGRIIPAIATTTSLVVGLDCIELYKVIQGHNKIEAYKSSFVNLALPFFGLSEPAPPKKSKYYDNEFSLWDRFEVKGEMTLKEFMDYFQQQHSLEITMLSQGVVMLYSFFMDKKKLSERLNMPLSKVVELVSKKEIPQHVNALVLEICCNDKDGNDLEVPYVKYVLPRN